MASVGCVWTCIAACFYLCESLSSSAVKFELKDKYVVLGLNDTVGAPLTLLLLGEYEIGAYDAKYEIERVVEIAFTLSFIILATHRVGYACKERGELFVQGIGVGSGKRAHHLCHV